ncbi:hypothetical protein ACFYQ5_30160 [Streptomyces sp. NPDC005794]|uniref:hypothetical protein n=1 Tax=Streptomyces sp. NPDC005794 TaxID=3364733 RepID=UPI003686262D
MISGRPDSAGVVVAWFAQTRDQTDDAAAQGGPATRDPAATHVTDLGRVQTGVVIELHGPPPSAPAVPRRVFRPAPSISQFDELCPIM